MKRSDATKIIFIVAFIIITIIALISSNRFRGRESKLDVVYFLSECSINESFNNHNYSTSFINGPNSTIILNESKILMNIDIRTGYLTYVCGVAHRIDSYKLFIKSNQSVFYKQTELKYIFFFMIFLTEDGNYELLSGIKTLWRSGWFMDDPNFYSHKRLAHEKAFEHTMEVISYFGVKPIENLSFQEFYEDYD